MEVEKVVVDKAQAKQLYREYQEHKEHMTPMDREIAKTYRLIAQGRVIIRAIESIRAAGVGSDGRPKLALARADGRFCRLSMNRSGSASMYTDGKWRMESGAFRFPAGTFPVTDSYIQDAEAVMPLIPVHLRPRTALDAYHVLWEAEWRRVPPRDPYLLRRLAGDLWMVVAAWDLTEVERAAMATRMTTQ